MGTPDFVGIWQQSGYQVCGYEQTRIANHYGRTTSTDGLRKERSTMQKVNLTQYFDILPTAAVLRRAATVKHVGVPGQKSGAQSHWGICTRTKGCRPQVGKRCCRFASYSDGLIKAEETAKMSGCTQLLLACDIDSTSSLSKDANEPLADALRLTPRPERRHGEGCEGGRSGETEAMRAGGRGPDRRIHRADRDIEGIGCLFDEALEDLPQEIKGLSFRNGSCECSPAG
jgi:hypothetical protein